MAEPLSTAASIIAVVSFAAESSKVMFKFFEGIAHAPANIHESALALKSLYMTLTNLQQSGTKLDPKYKFPAHFCGRLNDCLTDLKTFEAKIGKIDAKFGKQGTRQHYWDGTTRRSCERVRWLLVGERETRRFLERVKMYQNEFFLELLGLLTIINGSPTSSMASSESVVKLPAAAKPSSNPVVAHRLPQPLQFPEYSATGMPLSVGSVPLTAGIWNADGSMQCIGHPELAGHCGEFSKDAPLDLRTSCFLLPSIRVTYVRRWSFFLCDFVIRGGPAIAPKARFLAHGRKIGAGLGLSLVLPKRCRKKLDLAFYLVQPSLLSRKRLTLQCDINFPRIIPESAEIMQCVREDSVDSVQRLIGAGRATSKDITIHGITLLHLASTTSNLRLIRLLIQEGGDVNAQDEDGETPLHWAMARGGNYEVARLLIENGADLANNTIDESTPLHTYFNDTVAQVLLRVGWIEETLPNAQGMSIVHFLAWSSKSTSKLLEKGVAHTSAGLWSVDGYGRTCLHLAASRGNLEILGYLLERASLIEVRRTDNEGRTALHYTVQNKRLKTVDMLLSRGGDLYAKDNLARTVIHHAARWGNLEAAQKVVALGDSKVLLSPDKNGSMPSHLACGLKATAIRKYLVDLEAATSLGMNPERQYQSSIAGIVLRDERSALPSRQFWVSMMTLVMLLSALEMGLVHGIAVPVVSAIACILLLWVRTTGQPSEAGLPYWAIQLRRFL